MKDISEHKSHQLRPMKLLLPAAFLLILGLGNIAVGIQKRVVYQEVINELTELRPTEALTPTSPLIKFQQELQSADRNTQLRKHAEDRRDFYDLIAYGGYLILLLSLILFIGTVGLKIYLIWKEPDPAQVSSS
jgi:hypothetical protein